MIFERKKGNLKEFLEDQLVLTANINLENKNCLDYSQKDAFTIKNAIPTAEAAIALAVQNNENMLFGSNCLVVGYGKIGKILSHYLKCLGANVTASARKESDLSYIYSNGIEHIKTSEINKVADKFDFRYVSCRYRSNSHTQSVISVRVDMYKRNINFGSRANSCTNSV